MQVKTPRCRQENEQTKLETQGQVEDGKPLQRGGGVWLRPARLEEAKEGLVETKRTSGVWGERGLVEAEELGETAGNSLRPGI